MAMLCGVCVWMPQQKKSTRVDATSRKIGKTVSSNVNGQ